MHTDYTVQETLCTIHALFMHCSRDLQQLYLEKNNKNGPHGTIYTFKKKKSSMFSVFNKITSIHYDGF